MGVKSHSFFTLLKEFNMEQENLWKRYHGISAVNLDDTDKNGTLKILCPELSPFTNGSLKHKEEEIIFKAEDVWGTKQHSKSTIKNTIEAVYLGGENCLSIPDVVVGEQLIVHQYGEDDIYYWSIERRDENLRLREHYRITCTDSPTRIKVLDDDNTYFFEINSKIGHKGITLSTTQSDGEAFRYQIKINCDKSHITMHDNVGNLILLDSVNTRILLENKDKTKVDLDKRNLFLLADNVSIVGRKLISTRSPFLSINHAKAMLKIILVAIRNCGLSRTC